jgi:hypothetical protein
MPSHHVLTAAVLFPALLPCCLLPQSHDARVMSAWEAQQAQWQAQARHLAALLGQHSGQLALTTGQSDVRLSFQMPLTCTWHDTGQPEPTGVTQLTSTLARNGFPRAAAS